MSWINGLVTFLFDAAFRPLERGPGWLALVVSGGVLAILGLLVYRFTSNQPAIRRTKSRIKAELLAIKLFRDEPGVIVAALATALKGSAALLMHSAAPLLVMIVPFVLILAQLAGRYQWRPVEVGEPIVVCVGFRDGVDLLADPPRLEGGAGVSIEGPAVRIPSERRAFWRARAKEAGDHGLNVVMAGRSVSKSLTAGTGMAAVSPKRVGAARWEQVLYPGEEAIPGREAIEWVAIDYPPRESWFCGSTVWVLWLMGVSYVWAVLLKRWMGVEF